MIVETVGVGQSETTVASMVDFFLVLMLAGAGDELQGIKKGVLELADAIAINKADGDNVDKARARTRPGLCWPCTCCRRPPPTGTAGADLQRRGAGGGGCHLANRIGSP
jgi:hypothetical protein